MLPILNCTVCFITRFKYKYHPDECGKRREESRDALQKRCDVFTKLGDMGQVRETSVDFDKNRDIIKLLDAAVIMMEGGTDLDLEILDQPEEERDEGHRRDRRESERSQGRPERRERSASVENRELRKKCNKLHRRQGPGVKN